MTFNIAAVSRSSRKGLSDQKQKDSGSRCELGAHPKTRRQRTVARVSAKY